MVHFGGGHRCFLYGNSCGAFGERVPRLKLFPTLNRQKSLAERIHPRFLRWLCQLPMMVAQWASDREPGPNPCRRAPRLTCPRQLSSPPEGCAALPWSSGVAVKIRRGWQTACSATSTKHRGACQSRKLLIWTRPSVVRPGSRKSAATSATWCSAKSPSVLVKTQAGRASTRN